MEPAGAVFDTGAMPYTEGVMLYQRQRAAHTPSTAAKPEGAAEGSAAAHGVKERERRQVGPELGQLQPFTAVFPQECMGQLSQF